jgi:predicted phosphate transport protein (TIGR00153 family)
LGFKLKPQDDRFFHLFEEASEAICEATQILKEYFANRSDPNANLERINKVEHRGDRIFGAVMEQINHSFVTPFDREDILGLAQSLNQVLDHIQGTMEKMVIYKCEQPQERYIPDLVNVLEEAAGEIIRAVSNLRDIKSNHNAIVESCEKIRAYEHEGDNLYRAGIARLFEQTDDAVYMIKWKEIYEHLETTLDYCEDVSNVLKGIAVKYV